jgi:hypothetical protein
VGGSTSITLTKKKETAMKSGVYLAGKMERVSIEAMKGWRQEAQRYFDEVDIPVWDPTRRIPIHLQIEGNLEDERKTIDACRKIFKMDLQDICKSTVILADVRRYKQGEIGIGTSMELMFAHTKNKIIILWADKKDPIHPFLEAIATEKYYDLEEAMEATEEYFDDIYG